MAVDADLVAYFANIKVLTEKLHRHILTLPSERFHGKPRDLITEIATWAETNKMGMLFHGLKIQKCHELLAAMDPKPKVILEYGTYVGNSALGWGASLLELHGRDAKDIHVYGFELDAEKAVIARDAIKLAGLEDIVTVITAPGGDALKQLLAEGKLQPGQVDVILLDHWKDAYLPDLVLCETLGAFHEGSLILADNTDFPGAPDYVEYVKKGGSGEPGRVKYETETLHEPRITGENESQTLEVTRVVALK
ncbi:S-adenosyl-L-methionine-dependent methyltransferase [Corynespora cassiicola Philippines]|uniref:catechol O-methyltransferase n=1 Tax=Corynespora cassiicola Philippines TaxID=1448308 RepID=A0A2T2NSP6_CORCC|nr:S-adenosyl-L-methionine-dependent methyltransferase [Corynespora cassiicola Philippines]